MEPERRTGQMIGAALLDRLVGALFPPRCAGCGLRGTNLCTACAEGIPWLGHEVCPWCAAPSRLGRICRTCSRERPILDGVRAACNFDGVVRQAVHDLKYRRIRSRAAMLAGLIVTVLEARPLDVDLLVSIPLAPGRLRERGFNQSALVAEVLGERLAVPVLAHGLTRVRETPRQVGKVAADRLVNVARAFACDVPEVVVGQRVAILDDVMTTGATLNAAAEALRMAGARRVYGIVVAREA